MLVRSLLLVVSLSWLPPLANCDGTVLTDLDHYELWTERIIKIGEVVADDGSITDVATRTVLTVPLPLNIPSADLAFPDTGGMVAWRVGARDHADNPACGMEEPTP